MARTAMTKAKRGA
jgi:acetyl-CoA acyltransferase 1